MKAFVCNDKNGTPLYDGDEVICPVLGGTVGVMCEINVGQHFYQVKFIDGIRSVYSSEIEKVQKEIVVGEATELQLPKNRMIDTKLVDYITATVKRQAEVARYGAGMSGDRTDGGAAEMERHLAFWILGVFQTIPVQYNNIVGEYEKQQLKENDPDYQLFLALKEKYQKFDV